MKGIDENHSFNIHIAKAIGIEKAILWKEIYGWCAHNAHNGKNIHLGLPWTFNTAKSYSEKFPYMAERSIGRWLNEMEEAGLVGSGNFNEKKYDKTKWHTCNFELYDYCVVHSELNPSLSIGFLVKLQTLRQNGERFRQNGEGLRQNGEPIPSLTISYSNIVDEEETGPAQDYKSQILSDEMFLETCARVHKLSATDVSTLFDEFMLTKRALDETAWKGYPQMRKNFLFWIPKRPQTKATNDGKQQPARPANGKLVSEETQRRVYAELLHEFGVTGGQG